MLLLQHVCSSLRRVGCRAALVPCVFHGCSSIMRENEQIILMEILSTKSLWCWSPLPAVREIREISCSQKKKAWENVWDVCDQLRALIQWKVIPISCASLSGLPACRSKVQKFWQRKKVIGNRINLMFINKTYEMLVKVPDAIMDAASLEIWGWFKAYIHRRTSITTQWVCLI